MKSNPNRIINNSRYIYEWYDDDDDDAQRLQIVNIIIIINIIEFINEMKNQQTRYIYLINKNKKKMTIHLDLF